MLVLFAGVHADGQYQASTFQNRLYSLLSIKEMSDPYFLVPWDASHWLDLAIVELRENSPSSSFRKLLIKRSSRLHTMFGSGRGHAEYKGFAKIYGLKALETVTYATTRFSSSAFEQWEKIYASYSALIKAFIQNREHTEDECEETKFQVRGQDYAIDLCGTLDILKPAVTLMIKSQALSVPPWKIVVWFQRMTDIFSSVKDELERLKNAEVLIPDSSLLPKLAMHWEELTREDIENCTFQEIEVYEGWLVVDEHNEPGEASVHGGANKRKQKKTITWKARSPEDCIEDLLQLNQELQRTVTTRFDNLKTDSIRNMEAIFDIKGHVKLLCLFSFENGRIKITREARQQWDLRGKNEFADFFRF